MKFFIAVILASVSESLNCDIPFDFNTKDPGESGAFMMKDLQYPVYFSDDCKNCLWLTGSDWSNSIDKAADLEGEKIHKKIVADLPAISWGFKSLKTPDVSLRFKPKSFIEGDVCCPVGKECTVTISWDGRDKFNIIGFSVYTPQSGINTNGTSQWILNFSDKHFFIYHHIPGGFRRKFLSRSIDIRTEGQSIIGYTHLFNGDKSYSVVHNDAPSDIIIEEMGENGKISYLATVLGYINN